MQKSFAVQRWNRSVSRNEESCPWVFKLCLSNPTAPLILQPVPQASTSTSDLQTFILRAWVKGASSHVRVNPWSEMHTTLAERQRVCHSTCRTLGQTHTRTVERLTHWLWTNNAHTLNNTHSFSLSQGDVLMVRRCQERWLSGAAAYLCLHVCKQALFASASMHTCASIGISVRGGHLWMCVSLC